MCRTDIPASAKLVYAVIRDRLGENEYAFPGLRRVARDCGVSLSTASESVDLLSSKGFIEVEVPTGNPGGKTNRYRFPDVPEIERTENRTVGPNVPKISTPNVLKSERRRTENRTKPDQSNQTNQTIKRAHSEGVEAIYAAYPRKVGPADTKKAISHAVVRLAKEIVPGTDPEVWLLGRVQLYAAAVGKWPEEEHRFIPHSASWFRKERYHDDEREWQRTAVQAGTGKRPSAVEERRADKARREFAEVPDARIL